jgi:hypothetical protein
MDDSSYRWNFDLDKKNEIHYQSIVKSDTLLATDRRG